MTRLRALVVLASADGTYYPGTEFEQEDEPTAEAWIAAGAAELVTDAPPSSDDGTDDSSDEPEDLEALGINALRARAGELGVSAGGKKVDLVARIREAIAAKEADGDGDAEDDAETTDPDASAADES